MKEKFGRIEFNFDYQSGIENSIEIDRLSIYRFKINSFLMKDLESNRPILFGSDSLP